MKEEIVVKEDWKGEAIKSIVQKIGYGIDTGDAMNFIEKITDSVCKVEISYDTKSTN